MYAFVDDGAQFVHYLLPKPRDIGHSCVINSCGGRTRGPILKSSYDFLKFFSSQVKELRSPKKYLRKFLSQLSEHFLSDS